MKPVEIIIMNMYKDKSFFNKNDFIKEVHKFGDIDFGKIYREIVNYQIKKYGSSLSSRYTREESKRIYERRKMRRRMNREYLKHSIVGNRSVA